MDNNLLLQLQAMLPADFDARAWLAVWLVTPLPALGGCCPAAIDDVELVASLLAAIESGAYM